MRIAIVGGGISGMTAGWLLHGSHDITLFEANDYIGGHTHTVAVESGGETAGVDMGFIVYNDWTYPNFIKLLARLGVETLPSDMSFSVSDRNTDFEYCSRSLDALFAKRAHLLSPAFIRMLLEILRFNREAKVFLKGDDIRTPLEEWLSSRGYSRMFAERYLYPMMSAIWSANPRDVRNFPARHFMAFFENHGLLNITNGPQWRVIKGGSARYAEKLTAPWRDRIRLDTPVMSVRRAPDGVTVTPRGGAAETFDEVIFACHSDETLGMLADATDLEQEILGAIPYQKNDVVLHTDTTLLPRRRRAWASWNYHVLPVEPGRTTLTYNMQMLQSFDPPRPFCVSLNTDGMDPASVVKRIVCHHPVFNADGLEQQKRHEEINGKNRAHFCGAYWGYGFHEDGVNSALAVCKAFGKGL